MRELKFYIHLSILAYKAALRVYRQSTTPVVGMDRVDPKLPGIWRRNNHRFKKVGKKYFVYNEHGQEAEIHAYSYKTGKLIPGFFK